MTIARIRNTRTNAVVVSILGHYITFNSIAIATSKFGRRIIASVTGIEGDVEFRLL